ncbi:AAA family ATPase, partial [Ruminococcus callidus]
MLCSRCKKRPAVVFITAMQGEKKKNDGLCLVCAKELHVPQIDEYMKQMGITDEELEQISNQMMDMMDGESFEMGGSGVMPQFLQSFMKDPGKIFGNLKDDGEESNELQTADGDEEIPSADYTEIPSGSRRERRSKRKKELRFLGNYCTNLTRRAAEGKLDAIIGRDKEIARVIQILSRRTKNNPCLIGEPGVGKTAIAEGIALRIHSGNVPMHLKDKQVYLLDLTSLVAGTQFRGQFESRVKGLLAEVKQEGNIILFIDEVHNLVGAGNSEGAMNAANILKPALSRGEVQVIG